MQALATEDPLHEDLIDPPIAKKLGPAVITLRNVKKRTPRSHCRMFAVRHADARAWIADYVLKGRDEPVKALDGVSLSPDSEYYPIRRGEFVMLRGPSGGGSCVIYSLVSLTH